MLQDVHQVAPELNSLAGRALDLAASDSSTGDPHPDLTRAPGPIATALETPWRGSAAARGKAWPVGSGQLRRTREAIPLWGRSRAGGVVGRRRPLGSWNEMAVALGKGATGEN